MNSWKSLKIFITDDYVICTDSTPDDEEKLLRQASKVRTENECKAEDSLGVDLCNPPSVSYRGR